MLREGHGLTHADCTGLYGFKMNHRDNIRIFTEGVEDARHDQRSRSHEAGPAVNLKLTVDLGKRNLYAIPDEVIEILRVDVER